MQKATMTSFEQVFESGRTKPILVQATSDDASETYLVAKITGKEFDKGALTRELVASKLATHFGLDTPEPVLLYVPANFRELNLPASVERAIDGGFFPTFATRYLPTLSAFVPGRVLHERHVSIAAEIFAFDSLIVNRDRSEHGSVNCLTDSNRFVVIDHETALDGQLIGSSIYLEPWKNGALRPMTQVAKHIFYDSLVGREIDWNGIRDKWLNLTLAMVDGILQEVPVAWHVNDRALVAIGSYMALLIQNMDAALREVEVTLQ